MTRSAFVVSVLFVITCVAGLYVRSVSGAAVTAAEYEAQLRAQEEQELKDLKVFQDEKTKILGEKDTINRAIKLLDADIKEAQQNVKIKTTTIERLSKDIGTRSETIVVLSDRIDREKESLAAILRKTSEADATSITEVILGNKRISDFFSQTDAYGIVSGSLNEMLESIRSDRARNETERTALEDRKSQEENARQDMLAEQRKIERLKVEKNQLLGVAKNKETFYAGLIKTKEANIAKIRSALFQLRDTNGVAFGDAYDYALDASNITGVRPALILAILMQESSLGKNLGSCYLRDFDTGAGVSIKTGEYKARVMSPTRDVSIFTGILQKLGLSPTDTQVSCWIPMYASTYSSKLKKYVPDYSRPVGWGGAMGPTQFIPSTWVLVQKRVEASIGSASNPWDPKHAILASAFYLKDRGGDGGAYSDEKNAACQYYSGRKCAQSSDGNTYGLSVMKKAQNIQECMIDPMLGKSNGCTN